MIKKHDEVNKGYKPKIHPGTNVSGSKKPPATPNPNPNYRPPVFKKSGN